MKFLMNNKHLWIIPIYGVLYLISFFLLENSDVELNWIHCALDDRIPFCEYFVIPYVLWYFLIFATLWYFGFRCKDHTEYWQLVASIGTGMTVFLIVSYVYPNGHNLRPVLADGNVFVQAVKLLYRIDTPTNILPSMHVFDAVACAVAFCKNEECRKNKKLIFGVTLLAVLITLSTVFLKQHSLIDVALALLLYAFCYLLFYKIAWQHREWVASLLTKKEVLTIPNLLGVFRLVLAVLFMGICQRHGGMSENTIILTVILVLSGITDFLDGRIARKFNMVSEVGKILDPFADKVTQGVLLLCLFSEYKLMKALLILFVIKECYTSIMGASTVMKRRSNDGAQWYGKVSTAVFYIVMVVLIVFPHMPEVAANLLILCCGVFMTLSFVLYTRYYHRLRKKQ